MPELGKATYVIEIEERDFERKLDRADKRTKQSADAQDRQANRMANAWSKATAGVDKNTRASGKNARASRTLAGDTQRLRATVTRVSGDLDKSTRSADRNRSSLRRLGGDVVKLNQAFGLLGKGLRLAKIPALAIGAGLAVQAISALTGGVVALTSALSSLSGVLVAIPALYGALAQGAVTTMLALKPVLGVLKEMGAAREASGAAATKSASAEKSAASAVLRAKQSLAQADKQAAAAVKQLSTARLEARRQLQDMRLAAEGSALGEQRAVLAVQEARKELFKASNGGKASAAELKSLSLSVEEAELGLKESRLANKRGSEELATAEEKGVRGSEQMVQAREAVAQAHQNVGNQSRALAQAIEQQQTAMEGAGGAASKLANKMAELSPPAQRFAKFLYSLRGRVKDLQAAAGKRMFPGMETGIKAALKNFPILEGVLEKTGGAVGGLAAKAGKLVGSRGFGERFQKIGANNAKTIGRIGGMVLRLFDALSHVMVAARPFVNWLTGLAAKFGAFADAQAAAGQKSGKIADFFERTKETLKVVGHILLNLGTALHNVFSAARPLGEWILRNFQASSKSLAEWTESVSGKSSLSRYFERLKPTLTAIGRLFRDIVGDFFKLGESSSGKSGLAPLVEMLRTQALPAIYKFLRSTTSEFAPVLIKTIVSVTKLATIFIGTSGPLMVLMKVIGAMAGGIAKLANASPVLKTIMVSMFATAGIFKGLKWAAALSGVGKMIGAFKSLKVAALGAATAEEAAALAEGGGVKGFLAKRGGVRGIAGSARKTGVRGLAGAAKGKIGGLLGIGATVAADAPAGMLSGADMGAVGLAPEVGAAAAAVPPAAPWIALGAAVVAVGVGLWQLYKHSKTFREIVKPVTDAATQGFDEIKGSIGPLADAVGELGKAFSGDGELGRELAAFWHMAKPWVTMVVGLFKNILVGDIKGAIAAIALSLRGFTKVISGILQGWRGVVEVFTGILTLKFGKAWNGVKNIFGGAIKVIKGLLMQAIAPFKGTIVAIGSAMASTFGGAWDKVVGVVTDGVNAVIDVLNDMIGLVNKLPFIDIGKIGHVGGGGAAGGLSIGGNQRKRERAARHGAGNESAEARNAAGHARGGHISTGKPYGDSVPAVLERDEYVLNRKAVAAMGGPRALDQVNFGAAPRFGAGVRPKAGAGPARLSVGSLAGDVAGAAAGAARDVAGAATGAAMGPVLNALPDPGTGFFGHIAGYMKDRLVAWVKGENEKHQKDIAAGAAGYLGPAWGPAGTSMYKGILMADWVKKSLEFAASKGVAPQPTSGYRSHAQNVAEGRYYHSEHEKTQYPGGAVDFGGMYGEPAAKAAKMSVVRATAGYKWPLLAPIGFVDDGHASGTGHQRGGLAGAGGPVARMATGGFAGSQTVKGAPATSTQTGVAKSIMLAGEQTGATHLPEVAAFMAATQESNMSPSNTFQLIGPFEGVLPTSSTFKQAVHWFSKGYYHGSGIGLAKTISDPGVIAQEVEGSAYPEAYKPWKSEAQHWVDSWGGGGQAAGGAGAAGTKAMPKSVKGKYTKHFPSTGGGTAAPEEDAHYRALTAPLNFGAMPTKLKDIRKELRVRRRQLQEYRAALRDAKSPGVRKALQQNVTLLERRVAGLIKAQAAAARAEAVSKAVGKIKNAALFTDVVAGLGQTESEYNLLSQTADQVVSTEPEEPENYLGDWIKDVLEPYVMGQGPLQESGAFGAILGTEAKWRNQLLGGEALAEQRIAKWRAEIDRLQARIEEIRGYKKDKPNAWKKWSYLIPGLQEEMKAYRANIQQTRGTTIPEWEQTLADVQGLGASREAMGQLPQSPTAGQFGGYIWDTQEALSSLGLKLKRDGGGQGEDPLSELYKQIATESRQRESVMRLQMGNFDAAGPGPVPAFGGVYHRGGVVPGRLGEERTIVAEAGEIVAQPGTTSAPGPGADGGMPQPVVIVEDGAVNADRIRVIYRDEQARDLGMSRRRIGR